MTLRHVFAVLVVMASVAIGLVSGPSTPLIARAQAGLTFNDDDKTTSLDCKGGSLVVNGDDNTLTVRDDCNRVIVNGDDNTITTKNVQELSVSGDDNTVMVDTVARIRTTGDDNTITWARDAGGNPPEIANTGDDNKTSQRR